jgi:hypothetical protein
MSDVVSSLERLLIRRRRVGAELVYLDGFDRWGPKSGPEFDANMKAAGELFAERSRVTTELRTLSDTTRATCPDAVIAWAEAHIGLLERFIASHQGPEHSTNRFVADGEIAEWKRVKAGEIPFVDENCSYVSLDPKDHLAVFGPLESTPT